MRLLSVNVGVQRYTHWAGDMGSTGIDKRPVDGRIHAHATGLEGDVIVDMRHHGGAEQALYAYAREDALFWEEELGRSIPAGSFGENLTTEGIDVTHALIGERWAVGGAVLEVSGPRIPCRVFAGFWDVPDLIVRFTRHGAPGAYLRVVQEGEIGADDEIVVTFRPDHGVTNADAFGALTIRPDLVALAATAPQLITKYRQRLLHRVAGDTIQGSAIQESAIQE